MLPLGSSLLTAKANDFKAELTDRHYRWPARKFVTLAVDPRFSGRRIQSVKSPSAWFPAGRAPRYVLPNRVIKRDGDTWECLLADNPNVRLGEFLVRGKLENWENVSRSLLLSVESPSPRGRCSFRRRAFSGGPILIHLVFTSSAIHLPERFACV